VFWCALARCAFVYLRLADTRRIIRQRNESAQANRPRFSFAQASNQCSRRYVFDRQKSAERFQPVYLRSFPGRFADAFGVNINVAVVEVIALIGQFSASSLARTQYGQPGRPKITVNILSLLKSQPDGECRYDAALCRRGKKVLPFSSMV
jgi:hypothetical protein